jgi:hypothetical protein
MAEKRTIELEIQDNSKSLKQQYREAVKELQKVSAQYGETSAEALKAARAAAELKDQIQFSKDLVDNFNPDTKFNALSGSLSGVLNGFQAVEGAIGMVGVESEALQETMLRVQSVMAFTQGIDGLLEAGDAFKQLGAKAMQYSVVQKVVTAGQRLWNAAMAANPIGLLIAGITTLIAVGYSLIKYFQAQAKETEKATASIKEHNKALNKQNQELEKSQTRLEKSNKFQEDYAKASGKSSEELRKLAIKHAEEELALARKNKELAKATYLREKDILASMKANDADEEVIKKQEELVKKAGESAKEMREIAQKEYTELVDLKKQQRIEIKQEQTQEIKDKKDAAKDSYDAQIQARKNELDALIELEVRKDQTDKARLEKLLADRLKLEKLKGSQLILAQQDNAEKVRQAIEDDNKEELNLETTKLDKLKVLSNTKLETLKISLSAERIAQLEAAELEIKILESKAARSRRIDEQANSFKVKSVQQGLEIISSITELFGKKSEKQAKRAFQVQKAAQVASALINTYQSATGAYASQFLPVPDPTSPVRGGIAAGLAVAAGLVNVAKIASQKFEGGSQGGGGGGAPAGGGGGGQVQAPQFQTIGTSGVNQLATLQQQPTKAYVVSGEVTSAQSLDRNRVQNATL